jgi:hypothetical protein
MGVGWVERRVEEAGGADEYVVGFEGPACEEDMMGRGWSWAIRSTGET